MRFRFLAFAAFSAAARLAADPIVVFTTARFGEIVGGLGAHTPDP
jgi:hypothetical protein